MHFTDEVCLGFGKGQELPPRFHLLAVSQPGEQQERAHHDEGEKAEAEGEAELVG